MLPAAAWAAMLTGQVLVGRAQPPAGWQLVGWAYPPAVAASGGPTAADAHAEAVRQARRADDLAVEVAALRARLDVRAEADAKAARVRGDAEADLARARADLERARREAAGLRARVRSLEADAMAYRRLRAMVEREGNEP